MLNTIGKKGKRERKKSKVDLVDEEKRALRLRSFLRAKKIKSFSDLENNPFFVQGAWATLCFTLKMPLFYSLNSE